MLGTVEGLHCNKACWGVVISTQFISIQQVNALPVGQQLWAGRLRNFKPRAMTIFAEV